MKVHLNTLLVVKRAIIFTNINTYLKYLGKGCVFTYDAVGSYERVGYSAQGSGATLITPFLDNQLKSPSPLLLPAQVWLQFLRLLFYFILFYFMNFFVIYSSLSRMLLHLFLKLKLLIW